MSNNINELLPENWKEITFEDKIIFFNLKENLITFHPPFTLKNISLFFKLYEFKSTSEQFKKQLEDIVEKSNSNSTKKGKTEMTKEILNLDPIIDEKSLNLIKEFSSNKHNSSIFVLNYVCEQKYNSIPNFVYSEEEAQNSFLCKITIKNFQISEGRNKNKKSAKEVAIKSALEKLAPSIFLEQPKTKEADFDMLNLTITEIPSYSSPSNTINAINTLKSNKSPIKNEFLNKKRKSSYDSISSDDYEVLNKGSLDEKSYDELKISDPEVVEQYLSSSRFPPSRILDIYNSYYNLDLNSNHNQKNDDMNFDKILHTNLIKYSIDSQMLNIRVEAFSKTKKIAKELCSQKFLAIVYKKKFDKWVELVDYYDKKKYKTKEIINLI